MTNDLKNTISSLNAFLREKNLFYFVRDPERGMGLETILSNYHLVHILKTQFLEYFRDIGLKHFCLEEETNTINDYKGGARILFQNDKVLNYLQRSKGSENFIQTFKISPVFERTAAEHGLKSLNSSAQLNRVFEEKLSQYSQLSHYVKFPKTIVSALGQLSYLQIVQELGPKFVVQFARGHTGSGTYVIETEDEYTQVQSENLQRRARLSSFIPGIPYTINACVTKSGVFIGGLSLQITGDEQLGATKGATIGNDWSKRTNITQYTDIVNQTKIIGELMYKQGFRGMFGVDFVAKETGEVFVIEINARQTASVPMYTKMQLLREEIPLSMLHLLDFFNIEIALDSDEYNIRNIKEDNYSQVFLRADSQHTIAHEINTGFYRLQGDNAAVNRYTDEFAHTTIFIDEDRDKALLFQQYATNIGSMERQSVLVLAPVLNRKLKPGEEVARIQLNQSSVDDKGNVFPWIKEALTAIKYHQL